MANPELKSLFCNVLFYIMSFGSSPKVCKPSLNIPYRLGKTMNYDDFRNQQTFDQKNELNTKKIFNKVTPQKVHSANKLL